MTNGFSNNAVAIAIKKTFPQIGAITKERQSFKHQLDLSRRLVLINQDKLHPKVFRHTWDL